MAPSILKKQQKPSPSAEIVAHAFQSRIATYKINNDQLRFDMNEFSCDIKTETMNIISNQLETLRCLKVNFELFAEFNLPIKKISDTKSFSTQNDVVTESTDLDRIFNEAINELAGKISEFQERDSGWALHIIKYLEINIQKFSPICASSYIPLVPEITNRKAVLNITNNDEECFKWCIIAHLHPAEHNGHRVDHYKPYKDELDFSGISFPVKLIDIPRFETKNKISINVFGLEQDDHSRYEIVGPLHMSQQKHNIHINLLLIGDDNGRYHYCLIKDLSRLVGSQLSRNEHRKFICNNCLARFAEKKKFKDHIQFDCDHIVTKMPTDDPIINKHGDVCAENMLKFDNFERSLKVPFVIYADFESILQPVHTCQPDPNSSYTQKTDLHLPYSFAYNIKCSFDDSLSRFVTYRGEDAAEVFVHRLEGDVRDIFDRYFRYIVPIRMSEEDWDTFAHASTCHICDIPFDDPTNNDRVKDHCHLTGRFRGAAHSKCNLNYKIARSIPVFCHNLSNYDAHLFIERLADDAAHIDAIAKTKECYITFSKQLKFEVGCDEEGKSKQVSFRMRFVDSFRFMSSSLEKLAGNLNVEQHFEVRRHFPDEERFNLMRRKGVFPYSYVDSFAKLATTTKLPRRQEFFNNLTNEHASKEDYERAETVWKVFNCQNLGDYSDIYLKSDVLILTDVFESFRKICIDTYQLDPAHYCTAPGLSWDAMLKCTQIELELLTDIEMLHFIKHGIRGGICSCIERKTLANNVFLPHHDPLVESSFILYLDATNLYGAAMSQHLPYGGFEWISQNQIDGFDVLSIPDDAERGFVLEVDLDYPEELHDLHNDLPFCAENIPPPSSKFRLRKLIPNLLAKTKYVIHYRNLKQALRNGLQLKKIHRILTFQQSPWLRRYIDLNTERRNAAVNSFEKDFYKLMINSVFGKTMEAVEKRVDIRLVTHWQPIGKRPGAKSLIAKPNFKNCSIFNENFVAIQLNRALIKYNKPIYIGFAVLDISKIIMYDFYYGTIKRQYGPNARLLYTDTDSLILHIKTKNVYDDIKNNLDLFDTSNYPLNNIHDIPINQSIIGKMKDEYKGRIIYGFYGLGAKSYCVDVEGELTKKAKGVKRSVVDKEITLNDYDEIVSTPDSVVYKKMPVLKCSQHQIFTEFQNKISLSYYDDKRVLLTDSFTTLAWGHYKI